MSDNIPLHLSAPNPEPSVPQLSTPTLRQRLIDATYAATKKTPRPWQLDVAEALCNRRDVLCVAGTGKGKTLAFVMPHFVDPRALIWVVSPLNYIQQEQERVFRDEWNIPTCSVNATTSYPGLHKDILNGKFRVIITSPERLLEFNKLRPIIIQLGAQNWNNIVIVDECHCICIWSDQFRKMYGLLGTLRIFLLPGTPFCAATATATQSMQKQIRGSLRFTDDYLFVNEGYWKPNLSWHVHYMQGSDSSIREIAYALPRDLTPTSRLPMTIIFVDKRGLAFDILRALLDFLPNELAAQVEIYHAMQSQLAKDLAAGKFKKGLIRILICTEALTMGCDFRDIELVILFKVPMTLSTVLQRGGRGGRNEEIWCRVVLMVEASKHKTQSARIASAKTQSKRIKNEEEEVLNEGVEEPAGPIIGIDEVAALEAGVAEPEEEEDEGTREAIRMVSTAHGKEDEIFLRLFYERTDRCRTSVLDKAFSSPPHAPCISVNGCDNCIRQRIKELEAKPNEATTHHEFPAIKQEPIEDDGAILSDTVPSSSRNTSSELRKLLIEPPPKEPPPKAKERAKYRPVDERSILEESLGIWRRNTYLLECKGLGIHADHIITDKTIASIARVSPPVTLQSLAQTTPTWPKGARRRWGPSLLAIIADFDSPIHTEQRKAQRAQLRKETRSLQANHKIDATKVEDDSEGSGGSKRKPESSGSVLQSAPKKQRMKVKQTTNAESAASADDWARPNLTQQRATGSTTPEKAPNEGFPLRTTTPTASTSSWPPETPPRRAPATVSPHYRQHTYRPALSSPLRPHSPQISPRTPESTPPMSGPQVARAIGTICIQTTRQPQISTPTPRTGSSSHSTQPHSSPVKNPGAKREYYRGHLWKEEG